jgi:hypothetical protein
MRFLHEGWAVAQILQDLSRCLLKAGLCRFVKGFTASLKIEIEGRGPW